MAFLNICCWNVSFELGISSFTEGALKFRWAQSRNGNGDESTNIYTTLKWNLVGLYRRWPLCWSMQFFVLTVPAQKTSGCDPPTCIIDILMLFVICGNKMPTRCNRGFYCKSYCLLNIFRAPLCLSSGAQEYYTVVAACGISCCGFQVDGLVWSWGLCVRFAGCWFTTRSNHCIILLSSWWWA